MILSPEQNLLLGNVRNADDAWRKAKATIKADAKKWAEDRLASFSAQRDHAARKAFEGGVPKKQISEEGLLTTARITLEESLSRTEEAARALAERLVKDPFAARYSINEPGTITVTMMEVELAPQLALLDWPTSPADVIEKGLNQATFSVVSRPDKTRYLRALTAEWLDDYQNAHPVVAWATAPDREAEALDWFTKQ